MKLKITISVLVLALSLHADFYKNSMEGWFAYKDTNTSEKKDVNATKNKKSVELPQNLNDLSAKEFSELMTEAKETTTMHPTKDNVKNLIILQNFMHAKADDMTSTWSDVMLENPELDISFNLAKTAFAKNALNLTSKEEKKDFFDKNAKEIVLVLFYDSDKREITKSQDNVFNFIKYTYPNLRQLKIDVNNRDASELFAKLKIKKDITPDIWIISNKDGRQKWKRVAAGLSTQDKILDKIYNSMTQNSEENKQ